MRLVSLRYVLGATLRSAILEVEPGLKGKIDRFGSAPGGEARYLIAPYLQYLDEEDLSVVHTCATNKRMPTQRYYACFAFAESATIPMATQSLSKGLDKRKPARR